MTGIEVNERSNTICFAVFIKRISVMGRIQQEFFNMEFLKIGFHREKGMQEWQHIMPGRALKHWENWQVIFGTGSNKHVEMVTEKIFIPGRIPSPVAIRLWKLSFAATAWTLRAAAGSFWAFQPCCFKRRPVAGKWKPFRIYQSLADRRIEKLGFVQPKDKVKGIIVWKVHALHKWKEFCGSAVSVARGFITAFFTLFRFWLFMFHLINVIIFVRLP